MDGKTLARIGVVIFVGAAVAAAIVERSQKEDSPTEAVTRPSPGVDADRAVLRRCRDLGEGAARDPLCLRAWAESRRRFLGQGEMSATMGHARTESAPSNDTAPAAQPAPAQTEAR
ncbi:MAG: hypothetical protein B7X78_00420 [Sphingomonadales bacterium 39-62-4]|nr:MAG: hypothetical protein B7X78_00420 [Sphingomonadales bacterium 39-62-4]